jgi:hypothetical protein
MFYLDAQDCAKPYLEPTQDPVLVMDALNKLSCSALEPPASLPPQSAEFDLGTLVPQTNDMLATARRTRLDQIMHAKVR